MHSIRPVVEGKKDVEESEVGSEIKHFKKFDKMAGAPIPGPRPVFVFPGSLDFYLDDQSTHKYLRHTHIIRTRLSQCLHGAHKKRCKAYTEWPI